MINYEKAYINILERNLLSFDEFKVEYDKYLLAKREFDSIYEKRRGAMYKEANFRVYRLNATFKDRDKIYELLKRYHKNNKNIYVSINDILTKYLKKDEITNHHNVIISIIKRRLNITNKVYVTKDEAEKIGKEFKKVVFEVKETKERMEELLYKYFPDEYANGENEVIAEKIKQSPYSNREIKQNIERFLGVPKYHVTSLNLMNLVINSIDDLARKK